MRLSSPVCRRFASVVLGDYRIFEHTHPRSGDAVFLWALERQRRVYLKTLR